MKKWMITILLAGLTHAAIAQQFEPGHEYDRVLKIFVENGRVDYQGLKDAPIPLMNYLILEGRVPETEFKSWSEKQQLAFLINLYNASTLQLIVDHYPVKSIKEIGSFFKEPWDQPVVPLF